MAKSLFSDADETPVSKDAPLAERLRPRSLDEVVGQEHLIGEGKVLRLMVEQDRLASIILWGPPGAGKTTIARIMAKETASPFISYSAVLSGIKEIKNVMAEAEVCFRNNRGRTVVFVDEIHRFNKAQQDAFLPYVESGVIILIGATTENPSFEVIGPLLSRCKVYVLDQLQPAGIVSILRRALSDSERGLGDLPITVPDEALNLLAVYANGDARIALNILELAVALASGRAKGNPAELTIQDMESALQKKMMQYDKAGEEHYNLISALHKSLRNSDVDASLYWLGRMLEGGEDPVYIARRMVRFASEDVGLADVRALSVALDATEAVRLVGLPECKLALAQAAVYLAVAPKSNALYTAYAGVASDVQKTFNEPPPLHIRNAPTGLMKDLGYGKGYQYAHNLNEKVADMDCLPDSLRDRQYYRPTDQGMERRIAEILQEIKKRKKKE
ncbi:MAG TPA: replication-associated recombination protein A [Acidobacteriota bacterium]|nr:replication-associated recombination protein A [Acidobacteriota bacterium]